MRERPRERGAHEYQASSKSLPISAASATASFATAQMQCASCARRACASAAVMPRRVQEDTLGGEGEGRERGRGEGRERGRGEEKAEEGRGEGRERCLCLLPCTGH